MQLHRSLLVTAFILCGIMPARAQIDPERRQLIQFGYNQPVEGKAAIAGYAFYYGNHPGFLQTNLTLRLAVAPVYIDSELGIAQALGEYTDVGIGLAGGGFADSYSEIRSGRLRENESYLGHGGEISGSIYHLFNPGDQIPLNGIIRLIAHHAVYQGDSETSSSFELPADRNTVSIRTGVRWGGKEPRMSPDLAMEISSWYEGQLNLNPGRYGFSRDRETEATAHFFWARALLIYTIPNWGHSFGANITAGTSVNADRINAYRLGGMLPLASEFPLVLPGYYYQELSARRFVLLSAQYSLPLDQKGRWSLTTIGSIAGVDYVPGLEQPGHFHSGVGGGLGYRSPTDTWQVVLGYSYGFDAIRSHGRGAQSVGLLCQFDLEALHRPRNPYFDINSPHRSRGLFRLFSQ